VMAFTIAELQFYVNCLDEYLGPVNFFSVRFIFLSHGPPP